MERLSRIRRTKKHSEETSLRSALSLLISLVGRSRLNYWHFRYYLHERQALHDGAAGAEPQLLHPPHELAAGR